MTATDTEKAIRDLVSGAFGDMEVEVSIEDAVVPGLDPQFRLLAHQVAGRKWMADRETGKKNGGILADDMGLGKTIQTIVRIVEGRAKKQDQKEGWSPATLVVCPVAVVSQWASEVARMAPGLIVVEHHGPNRTTDPAKLERAHVVVTSYTIVSSEHGVYTGGGTNKAPKKKQSLDDSDSDSSVGSSLPARKTTRRAATKAKKDALFRVRWWRTVLDEAHNIKNRNTKAATACSALESKFRWCLTGTPMQNSVEELFSLFKFLRVKPLNDWPTFNSQIAQPIKANRTARAMKRLHVVLSAVMLRRTKDTVVNGKPILELPERVVEIVDCAFDAGERAFYDKVNSLVQNRLETLEQQGGAARNYTSMLILLLRLRQACNHPSLVSEDYRKDGEAVDPKASKSQDGDDDADDLADQLAGMGLASVKRCQLCQTELQPSNTAENGTCKDCIAVVANAKRRADHDLPPDSSKIRKIMDILQEIDERSEGQEKTIIFSQFTSMLNIIEPFLKAEGIRYVRYDGSMNKAQREHALDQIKEENGRTRVILISFKAGSTGLNLTCCNNVILVDLWWNPALEDQAFDRAHRFGQKRDVRIRKLCVPDTVEQRILELQDKKRELAKAALSGDKMKNMRLGADELAALFRPGGHDEDEDTD
ncbi:SNF2 family N-terminal domain-containing protein [Rhodofomes roseus]|nr:SNF2 family N-terminal domain-containing protein [Rhodofomes roseus]KAH9830624.1 SNF2 family N-terminal domain-containing protein [Rhodofomes roseus]